MGHIAYLSNNVQMINFSRLLENVQEIDLHVREIVES